MEVDSKIHPFLSYILSLKPLRQPLMLPTSSSKVEIDVEANNKHAEVLLNQMPNLRQPELLAKMTAAVSDVVQTRSVLQALGERPDHEAVDGARLRISQIESALSKRLEEIVLAEAPPGYDPVEWRSRQAQMEKEARDAVEKEKLPYKAVVHLYDMHMAYEDLLKEAEARLVRMYRLSENKVESAPGGDDVDEEVVRILQEASEKNFEKVELRGRMLRFLPEAFGKLTTLLSLDLSYNKLEVLSDSIAGLVNLEILELSCNILVSLPDSIGLLKSLKLLNVSGNKLKALPDSISSCSGLIELDASFNELTYLPTNLGHELVNLEKLLVHLNKLRSLPSSVCKMKSLRYLDIHFNELRCLPAAIGNLTNLQVLNASSNFSDLVSIPDSIGELTNLVELDLSNNQIRELPYSFGGLQNLKKLNLDQNPLVIPPMEIVEKGVEAVKEYMAKRWLDYLIEEEQRNALDTNDHQAQNTWLQWGGSMFGGWISGVKESVTGYLGASKKSETNDYLEQQY